MDLAKVEKTYEGIRDLFLREQFMNSVNKNLQVFLEEHKVKSIAEMAELAEQYHTARGSFSEMNTPKSEVEVDNLSSSNNQTVQTDQDQKAYTTKERLCYFCHSSDHFVRNCPKKINSRPKTASLVDRGRGRGSLGVNMGVVEVVIKMKVQIGQVKKKAVQIILVQSLQQVASCQTKEHMSVVS